MILGSFLRALGQAGDARLRQVLLRGVGLAVLSLVALAALAVWAVGALVPDTVDLWLIGPVGGLDTALGWGTALLAIPLSVVLMMPVAALFTGFLLEDVAAAVEAAHYPALPPPRRIPLREAAVQGLAFTALLIGVNLAGFVAYAALGLVAAPLVPFMFWGLNGFLLGREYFTMVAARRMDTAGVAALRRQHRGRIWLAGALMAAPLSIPVLNLFVPVLGAATFTHLFHRIAATR